MILTISRKRNKHVLAIVRLDREWHERGSRSQICLALQACNGYQYRVYGQVFFPQNFFPAFLKKTKNKKQYQYFISHTSTVVIVTYSTCMYHVLSNDSKNQCIKHCGIGSSRFHVKSTQLWHRKCRSPAVGSKRLVYISCGF